MERKCSVENCHKPYLCKGFCKMHHERNRVHGDPSVCLTALQGTGTITEQGYRRITVKGKVFREHRRVMEIVLGRPLRLDEIVHHINGDKLDNRPENLEVMLHGAHTTHHKKHKAISEWIRFGDELMSIPEAASRSGINEVTLRWRVQYKTAESWYQPVQR